MTGTAGGLTWLTTHDPRTTLQVTAAVAAGSAAGLMCTPDWDLKSQTHTEHIMSHWPIIGFWLRWASAGYSLLCKRHRGLSHNWLFGTVSRVLFLGAFYVLITLAVIGAIWCLGGNPTDFSLLAYGVLFGLPGAGFLLAWWAQDFVHYRLDRLPLFY